MNKMQIAVRDFIALSQTPEKSTKPGAWPSEQAKVLCLDLIRQEVVKELLPAIEADDWPEIIDGAADALYVIFFLCEKIGIDIDPFYEAVHRANMKKFDGPIDPKTSKQLKPPGWEPPPIAEMLSHLRVCPGDRFVHEAGSKVVTVREVTGGLVYFADRTHAKLPDVAAERGFTRLP